MGSIEQSEVGYTDVLIIGAGFGAFTVLNRVRRQGYNVTIYEKGTASGGIWYWNCYPGARVDSESPIYQLFDQELYMDFDFKERYSAWPELRRYFEYVHKKWKVEEHIKYNKNVETALWDDQKHQWWVECSDGSQTYCRWLIPCLGFASKHYRPPFPGLGNFAGELYHTAYWPQYGVNMKGKKVALIGTGASGIQVAQEIGDVTKQLTVFQRTPNLALPMQNWKLDPSEELKKKEAGQYDEIFEKCRWTYTGFHYDFSTKDTKDDTPEDRENFYQTLFDDRGGFRYLLDTYKDMLKDEWANDQAYDFWKRSVRARLKNSQKQKVLAPDVKPHPFGTKRNSLEIRFYEVVDQDHVDIVDVNANPIEHVTEKGIQTKDKFVEADVIVLATGFDSVTGSLNQLNIRGTTGETIADYWKDGTKTSMGIAIPTFPNLFYLYGAQAPTAFSNGPSCTQFQAEFVEKTLKQAKEEGITKIDATDESAEDWVRRVNEAWNGTLYPKATGWYNGGNIPGKKIEPMNWCGGMPAYIETMHNSLKNNYQGWHVSKKESDRPNRLMDGG